jgi:hypothetical protein
MRSGWSIGIWATLAISNPHLFAHDFKFRIQEVETNLGVGYAVRLLDVTGDRRADITVVDQTRVLVYANPDWRRQTIIEGKTKPDNVCIAPHDIDGDGSIDFALGADWRFTTQTEGTVQWLKRGKVSTEHWSIHPIGAEPFVHRIEWVDLERDGRPELVVVPLLGSGADVAERMNRPVRIVAYSIPPNPERDRWPARLLNQELHVAHNFVSTDLDRDGYVDLLIASREGVSRLQKAADRSWRRTLLGRGNQATQPHQGASEIRHGRLASGRDYLATIEPWHGFQVVVYLPQTGPGLWERIVVDDQLQWGHAVWCADLDSDADHELIIGVRDNRSHTVRCGVRVYDPTDPTGKTWRRYELDPGGVAVEDLACADLDDDGKVDLVAVGRATHNVRIYWNASP